MLTLDVNGRRHELDVAAQTPLLFVLRGELGLASVRLGCGLEQCGACKVLVDGVATPCCARPTGEFEGRVVTTLEGLAERDDPLIAAFLDHNAAQCGYCLSGILIALRGLLDAEPSPSEDRVREALTDNLCRCGAQPRMLRAARAAIAPTGEGDE